MFSLSWFTTPAGICITVGVLLLIVALVLFIVTSKKDKKNKGAAGVDANAIGSNNSGVVNPNEMAATVAAPMQNGVVQPAVMPEQAMQMPNVGMDAVQVPGVAMQPVVNEVPMTSPVVEMPANNAFPAVDNNVLGSVPGDPSITAAMPVSVNVEQPMVQGIDIPSPEIPTITEASEPVVNPAPVDVMPSIPVVSNEPIVSTPVVEQPVSVMPETVVDPIPQVSEPVVSTAPNISEVVEAPAVSPVMPTDMNNGISVNEVVAPSVEQVVPELQGTEVSGVNNNVVPAYSNSYSAEVAAEPVSAPAVPIYGGTDPIVPSITVPAEEHQIYGGANPLENTQSVSITDIANGINSSQGYTAPVSGAVPTINTDTSAVVTEASPTVEPVVSSAAVPIVNPAPVVESAPVVPNVAEQAPVYNEVQQPAVAAAPVVNPINNNFSYQSAAAPQVQIPTPVDGNIQ